MKETDRSNNVTLFEEDLGNEVDRNIRKRKIINKVLKNYSSFPICTLRGAGVLQEEVHTREAEAEARPRPGVTLRAEGGARAPMYSSR